MEFRSCFLTDAKGSGLTTEAPRSSCQFERRIRIRALYEGGRGVVGRLAAIVALFVSGLLMAQSDSNYRLAATILWIFVFFRNRSWMP